MKFIIEFVAAGLLSSATPGQVSPRSFWFLFDENKRSWCAYADEPFFQEQAEKEKPLESARVSFVAGVPSVITYQVQPESGDWIIIDNYSFSSRSIEVKRATIYAQTGIQVIQEGRIRGGVLNKLRLISVKSVDGTPTTLKGIDHPTIAVKTSISQFPFLPLAQTLVKTAAPVLCGLPGKS